VAWKRRCRISFWWLMTAGGPQGGRAPARERGFQVTEAADGLEALAWCRAAMPRAVLLDWNMPVMSGIEFLRTLRAESGGDRARGDHVHRPQHLRDIVEALAAGADEFVMKPFDGEILTGKLEEAGL